MGAAVRFSDFEFSPDTLELRKYGIRLKVPDQSLEILALLLRHLVPLSDIVAAGGISPPAAI